MAEQSIEAIFNDKEVISFFKFIQTNLKKVKNGEKKFVGLLSAIVYEDIINHFQKEEGQDGPWQSWSPSYAEQMERIGRGGNQILQFSGKLRQNFKPRNVRKVSGGLLWYNDAQTKSGFAYAAAHDEGGPELPQRNFMWLSDDGAEKISEQTLAFMLDEGI